MLTVVYAAGNVLMAGTTFRMIFFFTKEKGPWITISDSNPSSSLTSVEQGHMLAQAPQAVERAEPPEHSPQRRRQAGAVCMLVESLHHGEFHEGQGQGPAAVHLQRDRGLVCWRQPIKHLYGWVSYEGGCQGTGDWGLC